MKPLLYTLVGIAVAVCAVAASGCGGASAAPQTQSSPPPPSATATTLVQEVRDATQAFKDVSQAENAGYVLFEGCVSSEDEGAMGVHYLNPALIQDGEVDVQTPELLVYEPTQDGALQLVAVEYITFKQAWENINGEGVPPMLEGQSFDFHDAPNRYAIPAVYGLHIWAWKSNSKGLFAEWNPDVTCEYYTPPPANNSQARYVSYLHP